MKALKAALNQCEDDLMDMSGFDGPALRSLRSPPTIVGEHQKWVSPEDYPFEMLRAGHSGGVVIQLTIDETGQLTNCLVLDSIGDDAFKKITCDLITKRAKFQPAASGVPIKAYHKLRIAWILPGGSFNTPKKQSQGK